MTSQKRCVFSVRAFSESTWFLLRTVHILLLLSGKNTQDTQMLCASHLTQTAVRTATLDCICSAGRVQLKKGNADTTQLMPVCVAVMVIVDISFLYAHSADNE
jgi:hypothetical protein